MKLWTRNILLAIVSILFINNFISAQTTYYVSSSLGKDSNSGKSESAPIKSLYKLNQIKLLPGDKVLFKSNDTWNEGRGIKIKYSGTTSNPIYYGSYGSGSKPKISLLTEIPNWQSKSSWTNTSSNIWAISLSGNLSRKGVFRLWIDGKEYKKAESISSVFNSSLKVPRNQIGLSDEYRFYYDGSKLYIYSSSNPAQAFNSLKTNISLLDYHVVEMKKVRNVIIDGLDLEGGIRTIRMEGVENFEIKNSVIAFSSHSGIDIRNDYSSAISQNGSIHDCLIKSGFSEAYKGGFFGYYSSPYSISASFLTVNVGVRLFSGASKIKVYNNEFRNWYFAAVQIAGYSGTIGETKYNEVFNNKISLKDISLGRSFHVTAYFTGNGACSYNLIYRNEVFATKTQFELGGDNNEVFYNIFNTSIDKEPVLYNSQGVGISFESGEGYSTENNKLYNNTFYNIASRPIQVYGSKHLIANNLIINSGQGNDNIWIEERGRSLLIENNLIFFEGKESNSEVVRYGTNPYYFNISDFNSVDSNYSDIINNNILFSGNLTDLIDTTTFAPKPNSPLINAGKNLGKNFSFLNDNNSPDIGAIEFIQQADVTPPALDSVKFVDKNTIDLFFNEELDKSSASVNSFRIDNGITVNQVNFINNSTVELKTSDHHTGDFNLSIDVADLAGNKFSTTYSYSLSFSSTTTADWSSLISFTDQSSKAYSLSFGQNSLATNGIDENLNEKILPPPPPDQLELDVRFALPISNYESLKDFRNSKDSIITWNIKLQGRKPYSLSWDASSLPAGSIKLMDIIDGSLVNVDMKSQNSVTINYDLNDLKIVYSKKLTINIKVNNGWNLVAIPFETNDMSISNLFQNASAAYIYDETYVPTDTLVPGQGYWVFFDQPSEYQVSGIVDKDYIEVKEGWNLVGKFNNVPVEKLRTEPANIVLSPFYKFNDTYQVADTLKTGEGYWVKVSQAGKIYMNPVSLGKVENLVQVDNNWGSVTITDAENRSITLYVTESSFNSESFELPPIPPAGTFDVRYSNNLLAKSSYDNSTNLDINEATFPVKITVNNIVLKIRDIFGGQFVDTKVTSDKPLTIAKDGLSSFEIETEIIPQNFTLEQNYPNPFNPSTTIKFNLPKATNVKLTIYNVLGERVSELINEKLSAGTHAVNFNATNFASGIYFYSLEAGSMKQVKKMTLMK